MTGQTMDYRFITVNRPLNIYRAKAKDIIGRTVREVMTGTEQHWIRTYGREPGRANQMPTKTMHR